MSKSDERARRDDDDGRETIRDEFRQSRREMLALWAPWIGLAIVVGVVAWFFVEPAPPKRLVIATGSKHGAYYAFAQQYAEHFKRNGITLEVRETLGSVENYRLLAAGEADVAIVQGGAGPGGGVDRQAPAGGEAAPAPVEAIASLYLEPAWVFYRAGDDEAGAAKAATQLRDLKGKRVAVGAEGSGTRALALELLAANGVGSGPEATPGLPSAPAGGAPPPDGTTFDPRGGPAAAAALGAGEVDAAFFVIAPHAPLVKELLAAEGVRLMSFDRHAAYARVFPYLSDVKLPRGVVDLGRDLPPHDVDLIAPAANLVARPGLHEALVPLLLEAAGRAHERGDLLSNAGQFPSEKFVEYPMNPAARRYFKSGPPLLQKTLPFWLAALIDRLKFLVLPLLTLLLPLMRWAPPLYRWRVRAKIYRWYRVLRIVDQKLKAGGTDFRKEAAMLERLERELWEMKVPLSYMEEFYNLRLHTDFVQKELAERTHTARRTGEDGAELQPAGGRAQ